MLAIAIRFNMASVVAPWFKCRWHASLKTGGSLFSLPSFLTFHHKVECPLLGAATCDVKWSLLATFFVVLNSGLCCSAFAKSLA